MIIKGNQQNSAAGKQSGKLDLPVKVVDFVTKDNGEVGVKGVDLSGNYAGEVTVYLTDIGNAADNPNRNTLAKLRDGFKLSRDVYQLVPGGVVSFKNTYPIDRAKGEFRSTWANVLAYNEQDTKYYQQLKFGLLRMHTKESKNENGEITEQHYGYVYNCRGAEDHIVGKVGSENLRTDILEKTESMKPTVDHTPPMFLIRVLNEANKVTDYNMAFPHQNASAEEIADGMINRIRSMQGVTDDTTVNIMPADKFQVSPMALKPNREGKSQATKFFAAAKSYIQELPDSNLQDIQVKDSFVKLSGEPGDPKRYVNDVYPVDRYGTGIDLALIGGLSYADPVMMADDTDNQSQANETNHANNQQPQKSEPAAPAETTATTTDDAASSETNNTSASESTSDTGSEAETTSPGDEDPFGDLDNTDFDDDDEEMGFGQAM